MLSSDTRAFLAAAITLVTLAGSAACGPRAAKPSAGAGLEKFVSDAKSQVAGVKPAEGSLWVNHSRQANLFRDFKARDVHDILTIRVLERTQAAATADATNSRDAQYQASISKLFGIEKKVTQLPNAASAKSASGFEGKGSTSRSTTLNTTLTARVKDVLPNGYLVVEGMREIRLNHENQTIYVSGVVRPEDVGPDNVVLSSAVAQMEVRVQGRGVVSEPLKPGWLYRLLMGLAPF